MPSVLFVCTGNSCRSPMAQVLFNDRLRRKHAALGAWRVESAGTWTDDGLPAAENARKVMAERGLDLSKHRSREVTLELLAQFNLILVMEANHKEALCAEFPALSKRVFLLSEMAGLKQPVEDPIGGDLSEYLDCANEIDGLLERGWTRILELS